MSNRPPPPRPFVTSSIPGIGGALRRTPDDFVVREILKRRPIRSGACAWVEIEKRGISTPELLRRLGSALRTKTADLHAAGYKDADAVTTQWISVPARFASSIAKLDASSLPDARVLGLELDHAPLDSSLIAANSFRITIRDVSDAEGTLARVTSMLDELGRRGIPNFYGAQRFGLRGESARVGAALLEGDLLRALDLVLGSPSDRELDPRARVFREAYEAGDHSTALANCPGALRVEFRLLEALARGKPKEVVAREIPAQQQRFYLSAWQSLLFNRVLAARLASFDTILEGDLVVDARQKLWDSRSLPPNAKGMEFTPTGPLFGERVPLADGEPGRIERQVLRDAGYSDIAALATSKARTRLPFHGERRPLRVPISNVSTELCEDPNSILVSFDLPSGAFATTLLAELMKTEPPIVES